MTVSSGFPVRNDLVGCSVGLNHCIPQANHFCGKSSKEAENVIGAGNCSLGALMGYYVSRKNFQLMSVALHHCYARVCHVQTFFASVFDA